MYTEEQILVLKSIAKSNLILHSDATGSVVRKIDQFQKKFLYYASTLQHPQMKISPIPLADMLSSNHTNVEITYFLHKWIYDVKLILKHDICPSQIKVDFSWAMLHGISKVFKIENTINFREEEVNYEFDFIDEFDEELPNEFGDGNIYKNKSSFGRYFDNLLKNCQKMIDKLDRKHNTTYFEESETYFLPDLPTFLVTYYMPICLLWSSLILGPVISPGEANVRHSNAIVESWMKIVKANILNGETKLKAGDFLRKMREDLEGRISAFTFAFKPLSCKIFKKRKDQDTSLVEETWQKRKGNKRTYFKKRISPNLLRFNAKRNSESLKLISEKFEPIPSLSKKRCIKQRKSNKSKTIKRSQKQIIGAIKIVKGINAELSSDDSIFLDNDSKSITFYNHGKFSPFDQIWQKKNVRYLNYFMLKAGFIVMNPTNQI